MFSYFRSFIILIACLFVGKGIVALTGIPISASIIGMLFLFILLALNILPVTWVKDGSSFLIKHMTLFFVPIGVGLMEHFSIIQAQAAALLAGSIGSSLIIFLVIGKLNHILATKYQNTHKTEESQS